MGFRRVPLAVALHTILAAAAIFPLLVVTVPPLVDYPNHLASAHILSAIDETPALQVNYAARWHLSTNMGAPVLISAMAEIMDIYDAGRVFVAISILLVIAGTVALNWVVHDEFSVWPLVAFLFIYNHVLFWGFLNFYFAAGLYLLGFAAWMGMREWRTGLRFGLFVVVSSVLYFCHLFALGMYGLSVFGYEIWRWRQHPEEFRIKPIRSWGVTFGQFFPLSVLLFGWTGDFVSAPGTLETRWLAYGKLISAFSPVLFNGKLIDIVTASVVILALYWCLRSRHVSIVPALRWPLALLAVAALLMPTVLLSVWGMDFRIPPFLAMLLVVGLRFDRRTRRSASVVAAAAIALFAWRIFDVSHEWHTRDMQVRELRAALQNVHQGARIMLVQDFGDSPKDGPLFGPQSYLSIGALGVIDRAVFMPSLFTSGHTQISAAAATAEIDSPNGGLLTRENLRNSTGDSYGKYSFGDRINRRSKVFWIGWPKRFDYVILIRFDNRANPVPNLLRPVAIGSYFDIYRVIPGRNPGER